MPAYEYDLAIIGAGARGLIAAGSAVRLGAKVALIEKDRIGGDCTWTGCMPSKALVKAAKIAHEIRTASQYGINAGALSANTAGVHDYVQRVVQEVYQHTTPEALQRQGVDALMGGARFIDRRLAQARQACAGSKGLMHVTAAIPRAARTGIKPPEGRWACSQPSVREESRSGGRTLCRLRSWILLDDSQPELHNRHPSVATLQLTLTFAPFVVPPESMFTLRAIPKRLLFCKYELNRETSLVMK